MVMHYNTKIFWIQVFLFEKSSVQPWLSRISEVPLPLFPKCWDYRCTRGQTFSRLLILHDLWIEK